MAAVDAHREVAGVKALCDALALSRDATALDEGIYRCSPRTMYRLLKVAEAVRERRDQLRHPVNEVARRTAAGIEKLLRATGRTFEPEADDAPPTSRGRHRPSR